MDSVTQIALGATVAAVCVPKEHRRKAAIMGAALGTLPDLDVLIDYGNAVSNFTLHRGFSHSLFVLIPFAALLWTIARQFSSSVQARPKAWFWAILLPLATHPLLDAHTAYGTQLFWPLDVTPTMWSTLFIIDPLYTLPLFIATLIVWIAPKAKLTSGFLKWGLILSSVYLGWSWVAKYQVSLQVTQSLNADHKSLKVFTTPTPFNTIFWRIVVVDDDKYLEGFYHFLHPGEIQFTRHSINQPLFDEGNAINSVKQLQWFADGFNRAEVIDGALVISDLRMGFENNYVFRHKVAEQDSGGWLAVTSEQLPRQFNADDLGDFWQMFSQPNK